MHLTPEGFPSGIPGIGDDIDIAIQQAPQPGRQSIVIRQKTKDKRQKTKDKRQKIKDKGSKIKGKWQ